MNVVKQLSSHSPLTISLEEYSSPLDLLLNLIKKQKMDILNLNISTITKGYLDYLKSIPAPDLENAGDFIRLAAILIYIKSKSLLPQDEIDEEDEVDFEKAKQLKENLIKNLFLFQKFQCAANILYEKNLLNRNVWRSQSQENLPKTKSSSEIISTSKNPLFSLITNYNFFLEKKEEKKAHAVNKPLPTLLDRIKEISSYLIKGADLNFFQLMNVKETSHSQLLTFLSLLELSKLGFLSLFQKKNFEDINIIMNKNLDQIDLKNLEYEEKDWMA